MKGEAKAARAHQGLGKLVNLQKLDISENAITALPADVSGLTALQKLNAKRNKIDCIPESATVTETGGFYSLTELNLAHNQVLAHLIFFFTII